MNMNAIIGWITMSDMPMRILKKWLPLTLGKADVVDIVFLFFWEGKETNLVLPGLC